MCVHIPVTTYSIPQHSKLKNSYANRESTLYLTNNSIILAMKQPQKAKYFHYGFRKTFFFLNLITFERSSSYSKVAKLLLTPLWQEFNHRLETISFNLQNWHSQGRMTNSNKSWDLLSISYQKPLWMWSHLQNPVSEWKQTVSNIFLCCSEVQIKDQKGLFCSYQPLFQDQVLQKSVKIHRSHPICHTTDCMQRDTHYKMYTTGQGDYAKASL